MDTTEYTREALLQELSLLQEECETTLMLMETDEHVLESLNIVLEAGESEEKKSPDEKPANMGSAGENKKQSLWSKLKAWLKGIINAFANKSKEIFDTNDQWLKKNADTLRNRNYTGVTLELVDYNSFDKITGDIKKVSAVAQNLINNITKDAQSDITKDDLIKEHFSKYTNVDGELADGLKRLFRVGNAKSKLSPKKFSDAQITTKVEEYIDYCAKYKTTVLPFIQNLSRSCEQSLNATENRLKQIEKAQIKESFISNGAIDFALLMEGEIAKRAAYVNKDATDDGGAEKVAGKNEASPTEIKIDVDQDKVKTSTKNERDSSDAEKDKIDSMAPYQLKYAQACFSIQQIIITAAMTVCEEMYLFFIKTLKSLLNTTNATSKKVNNDLDNEAQEEDEQNSQNGDGNKKKK